MEFYYTQLHLVEYRKMEILDNQNTKSFLKFVWSQPNRPDMFSIFWLPIFKMAEEGNTKF